MCAHEQYIDDDILQTLTVSLEYGADADGTSSVIDE